MHAYMCMYSMVRFVYLYSVFHSPKTFLSFNNIPVSSSGVISISLLSFNTSSPFSANIVSIFLNI